MSRENQICGVLDVQGFNVGKHFFTRKIGFVNNDYELCFEIKCNINKEVREKNERTLSHQKWQIHGIPINPVLEDCSKRLVDCSKLNNLIEEIYCRVKTENKPLIGIKNHFLAKILDEIEIPYFNFERERIGGESCPPLQLFDRFHKDPFCRLHSVLAPGVLVNHYRCALRKSSNIWEWLENKNKSDIFFDEIHGRIENSFSVL